jgi:DNA polymerase III subunit delta
MPSHLSPSALRSQIAAGQLAPLYLITGDDEEEKASLAAAFGGAIEEDLRAFNVERFYGGESHFEVTRLFDAARTLPIMASRRIILVFQAEKLALLRRSDDAPSPELKALEAYVKAPEPHATVVFVGTSDKRLTKLLHKHATTVECQGVGGVAAAEAWVRSRTAQEGLRIEPAATRLLAERAGSDMGRLRADVERVCLYVAGRPAVTLADVADVIGPATSQDGWALVRQLQQGSAARALRELALSLDAGNRPEMILGAIRWFVEQRLPSASMPAAVEALFRSDLALKSSGGDPRVLLERLIVELMALRGA